MRLGVEVEVMEWLGWGKCGDVCGGKGKKGGKGLSMKGVESELGEGGKWS